MTTVRIAHAEPRPGHLGNGRIVIQGFLVVLADDAGRRALPIWLEGQSGGSSLSEFLRRPAEIVTADAPEQFTGRLLRAAGAAVTGVDIDVTGADIDELTADAAVTRIEVGGPAGTRHIAARLSLGLAVAAAAGAPVRVADAVMDRLAVPLPADGQPVPLPEPAVALAVLSPDGRPRYEPRNLAFADGLEGWLFAGSFTEHASESHWHDYSAATEPGSAVISSAVPQPPGFAVLGQEVFADDYRGATVVFRGEFRTGDGPGRAGLFLRVNEGRSIRGPITDDAVFGDPDNNIVTIAGDRDWTSHEVEARVPEDTDAAVVFGIFLAGQGRIELRNAELIRVA
jgi:bifunctional DNase/RNase